MVQTSGHRRLPRLNAVGLEDLEGELAVFPLPGALLLPRGRLPLNIFEPRYLAMVDDALRERRLIGMIQPQEIPGSRDTDDDDELAMGLRQNLPPRPAPLYRVGCVGRLASFAEREDGTFSISLFGVARFRVWQEVDVRNGYRQVRPDFRPFAADLVEPGPVAFDRVQLLRSLRHYFSLRGFEARWEAIEQMDDETLITTLSMICPFPPPEKQALLEAVTLADRAQTLQALLEMAGHEPDGGNGPHSA
ncbi:LON peptidase substrate-binding domain-containing protein [Lichenicoccus roseus]|uniref:Peptidase n=1 Tax=Lichenicoccus roseus TaxID=2683649 RepID=A0A5R9JJ38_9PROT|nr:LON peptidase substrate-binding domain-containing protein [Lichenicoccus roseus]TLU74348.1 peptidase [Lichenicoccus roseus]